MKLQTKCPHCGSSATRSRAVVYNSGTSTYSGVSSSRGASFNLCGRKRPRVWFGSGSFSGIRQSLMAQSAGPLPFLPSISFIIVLLLLGGSQAGPLIAAIIILWFSFSFYYNNTRYINEWVCSKCGSFFDPKKNYENHTASRCRDISNELNQLTYKIYYPATEHERVVSIEKASSLLREIEGLERVDTIKNFYEIKDDLSLLKTFKPILDFLDKADTCLLKNDKKNEIKWLVEALHYLIKIKASRKKFDTFGFVSELTNLKWTIKYLKKRLIDAGYNHSNK